MVHIYYGVLLSHTKEQNLTICDSMDGPRGYYIQWNVSVRERQMPYDFTYMWNLKNKIHEQAEQKQTQRYREHFDSV